MHHLFYNTEWVVMSMDRKVLYINVECRKMKNGGVCKAYLPQHPRTHFIEESKVKTETYGHIKQPG